MRSIHTSRTGAALGAAVGLCVSAGTGGSAAVEGRAVFLLFTVGATVATITGSTAVGLAVGLCVTAASGSTVC
jgi:hypothetical protein